MRVRTITSVIQQAAPWLALTAFIGALDYVTPATYAFASMYFIPIFPAAWRSRAAGFVVAAASTIVWIACDLVQRPVTDEPAQFWNYSTRIVVFVLAVILASTLQREQHRIAELDRQRRGLLTLVEHEVPGPLRELANDLRTLSGIDPEDEDRLLRRADQLVFLSDDLASLGELEAGALQLKKRATNVVEMVHELRANASSKAHVLLTVPVAPLRVNADPDRLRQALDAMLREVSATSDTVSVDCRSDKGGGVSISIATATMTTPAAAAQLVRGDDPTIGARTQLARILLAAHGGTLSSARESMGRGQRLTAHLPV